MQNQGRVAVSESVQERSIRLIETAGLTAEYSTGSTPTGEWFALGTVIREAGKTSLPAWVLVGTGTNEDEAIQNLTTEIGTQARNLELV